MCFGQHFLVKIWIPLWHIHIIITGVNILALMEIKRFYFLPSLIDSISHYLGDA
jgi:hypothetical protein